VFGDRPGISHYLETEGINCTKTKEHGMNMDVFITGGSGFIGNAVARAFAQAGNNVTCLCGTREGMHAVRGQGFDAVLGDMAKPQVWSDVARRADVLVHAAHIRTRRRHSGGWLRRSAEARNIALYALVEAAQHNTRCRAVIYTSGVVAHGSHGDNIIDETTTPRRSAMGDYHLEGEKIIAEAAAVGIPAFSIRPGMVYGPAGSFAKFFLAVAETGKYRYPASGNNYFPFVHVDDLARAYVLAATKRPVGAVVDVVDDAPIRVESMAQLLLAQFGGGKASGVPAWLVSLFAGGPLAEMLVGSYRVTNALAKRELNWQPEYRTFEQGLPSVVRDYRSSQAPATGTALT